MSDLDFSDVERRYDVQAVERENEIDDERRAKHQAEKMRGEHHDPIIDGPINEEEDDDGH